MTKSKNKINILEFSDVHLGHHRTKTPDVLKFLYSLLPNTQATRDLDLIIIAGDLFDRLLYNNDPYVGDITIWMAWLLRKCEQYDIVLRILEGTPSHDRGQPKNFVDLHTAMESKADFKYVSDLEYEYHAGLDLSILYLPDEWHTDLMYTYECAKLKLAEHGQTQVDIAVMHGAFEYQYPPNVPAHTHSSELWQALVRYLIFIGHVHTHSQYGKILAAGSSDRLKHGEEEDKGALRVVLDRDHQHRIDFVKNEYAKIFRTIDCRNLDTDAAIELVKAVADEVPEGSYLRIWAYTTDSIASADAFIRTEYLQHYWDFKIENTDLSDLKSDTLQFDDDFKPVDLTPQSLPNLLRTRLELKGYSLEDIEQVMLRFKESA